MIQGRLFYMLSGRESARQCIPLISMLIWLNRRILFHSRERDAIDQTPSTPQLITANMGAAWGVLCEVSNLLDDKTWHEEVHYDCRKGKLVARHEQPALYQ